jgi:hypothetical protein
VGAAAGATFGATFLSLPVFFFEERSSFFFSVGAFAATFLSLPVFFFFFSVFFSRARSFSAAFAAFARSFSAAFSSRTRCLSASFASLARRFSASFSSRARCFAACFSSSACVCLSVGEAGQTKFFFTKVKKSGGRSVVAFRAHRLGPNERGLELVQQVVLDRAGDRGERAVRQQRVRERPEGHTREVAPVPVRVTLGTAPVGVLGVGPPAQVALLDALLALALRPSLEPGRIGFDAVANHGEWKKRDGERERERGEGVGRARNVSERKEKSAD